MYGGIYAFSVRLLLADAWRHTRKCKRLDLSATRALGRSGAGRGLYMARDDKCEPLAFAGANGAIYWIAPLGKTRLPFSARSITERTAALAKRNESQKLGDEISSTVSREADFRLGVASIKKTS